MTCRPPQLFCRRLWSDEIPVRALWSVYAVRGLVRAAASVGLELFLYAGMHIAL